GMAGPCCSKAPTGTRATERDLSIFSVSRLVMSPRRYWGCSVTMMILGESGRAECERGGRECGGGGDDVPPRGGLSRSVGVAVGRRRAGNEDEPRQGIAPFRNPALRWLRRAPDA